MKFLIKAAAFKILGKETEDGTIPLQATESGRNLFLKATAASLIDKENLDREIDFADFVTDEGLKQDLENGLTLLECFGIAEVSGNPRDEEKAVCVAGERDYRPLAAFLAGDRARFYGNIGEPDSAYYDEDHIRARQFNNEEYNFYLRREGRLVANLVVVMPKDESIGRTCQLGWLAVDKDTDEAETGDIAAQLLAYAVAGLKDDFIRYRYLSIKKDDNFVPLLLELGFRQIVRLENEVAAGIDTVVYDYLTE